jgi:hypothetical protein
MDDSFNIFKDSNSRWEGAICKSQITSKQFPSLVTPPNFRGGCVRCSSPFYFILPPSNTNLKSIANSWLQTSKVLT